MSSFGGNLGTQRTYSTGISYSPFGGMTREQYGTATLLYNKTFYNVRGQMFDRRVSSVNDTWDWNRGRLIWYYSSNHQWGGSGTDNNGNLIYLETWVPPPNAALDQAQYLWQDSYTYDSLNRLSRVDESSLDIGGGGSWQSQFAQVYDYDRYGNRTINQTSTWGANIPKPNFGVNANNQLTAPGGYSMTYDPAGNLTNDNYTGQGTRTYDAEDRMKQAWANSQWQTYGYDGDGHRIKRIVNQTETWQIYGLGGEVIAEYAANAASTAPQKEYGYRNSELLVTAEPNANVHWLVGDQLGTPRMIFDNNGSYAATSRHDYLPFGEELFAGTGGRTAAQGYNTSDGVRQHFTLKERDNETGLDYFGARYFASTQGRFISPDNIAYSKGTNPQSWNLYAYTSNNPLTRVDPNGRDWFQIGDGYGARFEWHKGMKYTYTDAQGKKHEAKDVGRYLLVVVKTGTTNRDGAEVVRITLWDQNKMVARNTQGFSGGEPGKPAIPEGVYHMNLRLRSAATDSDGDGGLDKNAGLQTVPREFQGSWGTRRAALEPWSANLPSPYVGNYLHGHLKERSTTLGCVCDRGETVIDAVFNINSKETPTVRAVVTDGPPKTGERRPGPYVVAPPQ